MKLDSNLASASARELVGGLQTIHAAGKDRWLESLTVGQILKGRILRHYGEGRYGVQFAGQERVVDSVVPLSVGEELSGKVIGVSERSVSMQLVRAGKASAAPATLPEHAARLQSANSGMVPTMMNQAGLRLDSAQMRMIAQVAEGFEKPELAIKVGLYLAKLGLPLSKELMRALSARALEAELFPGPNSGKNIPELISEPPESMEMAGDQGMPAVIEFLVEYFSRHRTNFQASGGDDAEDRELSALPKRENDYSSGQSDLFNKDGKTIINQLLFLCLSRILNIQTGAAYQHRFETLPIMVDGRIVEFDVALFDHAANEQGVRSRHLMFSLKTQLGTIVLDAHILNSHVHLHLTAESEWVAREFQQYHANLQTALADAGWKLEFGEYASGSGEKTPAAAVIDHVLAQESLQLLL